MDEVIREAILRRVQAAQGELAELVALLAHPEHPVAARQILWGAKVSTKFKLGVFWIEEKIGLHPDKLMPCIAFETGGTFSPSVKNMAGSGATGLIQFMPRTAQQMGTSTAKLAAMDAVTQLSFVYRYFKAFGNDLSAWSLEDVYMAILFPKAIGKANDWPMPWKYGSIAYKQNAGLDLNKDRTITKGEAAAGVKRMAELGQQFRG